MRMGVFSEYQLCAQCSMLRLRSVRISGGNEFHPTALRNRTEALPAEPRKKGTISKLERVPRVVSRPTMDVACTVVKQVLNEVLHLA